MDILAQIMNYEEGNMLAEDEIAFFQALLDTGVLRHLQGSYHRQAQRYLDAGLIHFPQED